MELGIYSFGDMPYDREFSVQERLTDLVDEIVLADEVGLDLFAIGEHHRRDFVVSSPIVPLTAGAARTKNIRLSSSVTVLSSEDPVRVYQQFATLDLISGGRAEIMAGRGSFIESYPLFGFDLSDYDALFDENLDLLLTIRDNEVVTWNRGKHRAPIDGRVVMPRALQTPLPVWIAVGGTPQSVVRAASNGLPMAIAIIGGNPARFEPYASLHRQVAAEAGFSNVPISINVHGFIADTSQKARDTFWPGHERGMNQLGRERGWQPQSREQFEYACGPDGNLVIGSPQEVIEKILSIHEIFNNERLAIQMSVGHLPHADMMRAIELYGTVVAPAVRAAVG